MLDVALINKLSKWNGEGIEKMQNNTENNTDILIENLLVLFFGIIAASLSWQCNKNTITPLRIFYAFFAFIFGFFYIVLYMFLKYGLCQ